VRQARAGRQAELDWGRQAVGVSRTQRHARAGRGRQVLPQSRAGTIRQGWKAEAGR
jgi:hypothetical protein